MFYMVSSHIGESNRSTHHMNEIMVLMQNYSDVQKYMSEAADSAGTSMQKYEAYTDSLAGKLLPVCTEMCIKNISNRR